MKSTGHHVMPARLYVMPARQQQNCCCPPPHNWVPVCGRIFGCASMQRLQPDPTSALAGSTLLQCHDISHDASGNVYVSGRCVGDCLFGGYTLSTAAVNQSSPAEGWDGPYAAAFAAFIVRVNSIGGPLSPGQGLVGEVRSNVCLHSWLPCPSCIQLTSRGAGASLHMLR